MSSLPPWLKTKLPSGENYERIKGLLSQHNLHTVCEEARCPNVAECWGGGTATFMVLGDTCTRGCRFCAVASAARPAPPDAHEPAKLAETIASLGLDYIVLTTVCRDDLPDQGAAHVADCIQTILARNPGLLLEALIQDFRGDRGLLIKVVSAGSQVVAHNLETIERLTPTVRDQRADYRQSLNVLRMIKSIRPEAKTKSSIMLGLGETEEELRQSFLDLREADVDILTLGQYLRPTSDMHHLPVASFIRPEDFERYGQLARSMGFLYVASGPFVRSSYRAGELFLHGLLKNASKDHAQGVTPHAWSHRTRVRRETAHAA